MSIILKLQLSGNVKKFCRYIHNKLGLYLGIFLVIQGLTGSLLIFALEIDQYFNPLYFDSSSSINPDSVSYQTFIDRIEKKEAPSRVVFMELPAQSGGPIKLVLDSFSGRRIYLNSSDGKVLGERLPVEIVRWPLYFIHTGLFAGSAEHLVAGIMGGLLLILSLSGLVSWWPAAGGFRRALRVKWNGGAIRVNRDIHNLSGVLLFIFYIFLSLTGLGMVLHDESREFLYFITGRNLPTPVKSQTPIPGQKPSLDQILRTARETLPGAKISFISIPLKSDKTYDVRLRHPEESHPNGMNVINFDAGSGAILRVRNTRDLHWTDRVIDSIYPLHIGRSGGSFTRFLFFLIGLTPGLLFLTGLIFWYKKKRAQIA